MVCSLLAGCGNFTIIGVLDEPPPTTTTTTTSTLKLSPATVNVLTGGTQRFTATGGTGGYSFSVLTGGAGGFVDSSGLYTAPGIPGTDSVIVTDSSGATSESVAQVMTAISLSISPTSTTVNAGGTAHFTASGGSGTKIWARTGLGTLTGSGSSADYTAPWQGEASAIVSVTDSSGTATAAVVINPLPALQITPLSVDMNAGSTVTFTASGGSRFYVWAKISGLGTLTGSTDTATYTASGSAETATIRVTDSNTGLFVQATANVTVPLSLTISPKTYTLGAGGSVTFSAGGGAGGYVFSKLSGDGTLAGATYTAPWSATTAVIRVTDSAADTDDATVYVNPPPPLTITPSTIDVTAGDVVTFTAGGGSGSYSFSLVSGAGSLTGGGATASYTTVTAETADIRLTDVNTSGTMDATVNAYLPLTLVPATATVQVNGTYPFTANGGKPPYSYAVVSGGGSIDAGGVFTAPSSAGTSTVRVTDTLLNQSTATVTIEAMGAWSLETIDASSRSGQYASLALDSSGLPKIAYYESGAKELRVAAYNGSSWSVSTVDTAGRVGQYSSLALKPGTGYPGISYYDSTNKQLDYAAWNGSGWDSPQVVDTSGTAGLYTSLAMDSGGNPRISYYDQSNNRLKYASWSGSSWSIQNVNSSGSGGMYSSLALDPATGHARISFYDNANHLSLATWNGSAWTMQTVDGSGDVGMYSSLALEPGTGYARISYYDRTARNLKFASWDGSSWSLQTVDSPGDVGSYSSVALQPGSKNPGISYYDATNRDAKYVDASWGGSSWVWNAPQVVDGGSVNNVGQYTALAFDPATGKPRIAYYDQTAQDLKFAKQQ